jgi:thiamine pyrophosphokinase
MIVRSQGAIILVGAGDVSAEDLKFFGNAGHRVVAADGGAVHCLDAGILPDAVIGDIDSLPPDRRALLPPGRLHRIAEQETTDFEKCLRSVEAPLVLAFGVAGPRLDHTLAVCAALVRDPGQRVVVVGRKDLMFNAPPALAVELPMASRFSLFPMARVTGRSEGLRWPIDGIVFEPLGRIGTSNEVTGPVRLAFDGPGMLVITPREALEPVCAALTG